MIRLLIRRIILAGSLTLISGYFISTQARGKSPEKSLKRMNILFLMSDQHRGDFVGAAGADWVKTPNLDMLAAEGVIFSRAYSSVPSCLPARTSILTGMSPWQSGQLGYSNIPEYPNEGPVMFTSAGYRTHAVGKNHFAPMRNKHGYQTVELEEGWYTAHKVQEKCDFTLWFEKNAPGKDLNASGLGYNDRRGGICFPFQEYLHPTAWTADRAVEFLKSYRDEAPWMLKVSFQRPHCPYDPPQRWHKAYQDVDPPAPSIGEWAENKYGVMDGMSMLNLLKGKKWRQILDLEHAQIYEKDNAWVAITDGKYKYIYFTLTGQEQLFDIENDPGEISDLVLSGKNVKIVQSWRKKMVAHLRVRGEDWVKDGELVVQKVSVQFGKNHPKFTALQKN